MSDNNPMNTLATKLTEMSKDKNLDKELAKIVKRAVTEMKLISDTGSAYEWYEEYKYLLD